MTRHGPGTAAICQVSSVAQQYAERVAAAEFNELDDADRGESAAERLDRNWNEFMQELRVIQNGVQILFAFLLTLPFQSGFDHLQGHQKTLYVVVLGLVTASIVTVMGPAVMHRVTTGRRAKDALVETGNKLATVGLYLLAAAVVCAVGLVVDVVVNRTAGFIAAGIVTVVVLAVWTALPRIVLRGNEADYE